MAIKPKMVGTLWLGFNKLFVHGPRFYNPDLMKRLWVQGSDKRHPRYVMGETANGGVLIQSILRPVYPGESSFFNKLIVWDEQVRGYVFPRLRIRPFATFQRQKYSCYSFAFDPKTLNMLINHIALKNYYRVRELMADGIKVFVIYRRRKEE
jgi:hypothetical protein